MSQRKMWDQKEDNMIRKIVQENESRPENEKWKWSNISEILQERIAGCVRSGKQCRERWFNHLDPTILKHRELTSPEINKLFELQGRLGNKWAIIAKEFPGRTDSNLKNFFYSSLRRAVRQVNTYLSQYRKKSNIKPFKQTILTKVLKISDAKYREKLDIKSKDTDELAKKVKNMLSELSLSDESKKLSQSDLQFRQKLVQNIQAFNKNCKKRKEKKIGDEEEPDYQDLSEPHTLKCHHHHHHQDEPTEKTKYAKTKPIINKKQPIPNKKQSIPNKKQLIKQPLPPPPSPKKTKSKNKNKNKQPKSKDIEKEVKIQENEQNQLPKELFKNPFNDVVLIKKKSQRKQPEMEELQFQSKMINMSFDLFRKSSAGEIQPLRLITRKSSYEDRPSGYVYTVQNWQKNESKAEVGLFPSYIPYVDPSLLQSIEIGDAFPRISEHSATFESGLFKMFKADSKTEQGNVN